MKLGPLDHVYYWTEDMDRAVSFYEGTLGPVSYTHLTLPTKA